MNIYKIIINGDRKGCIFDLTETLWSYDEIMSEDIHSLMFLNSKEKFQMIF